MVATIIGWYGTETMGDRAILDGIISVLGELCDKGTIMLGSLYPFYTMRTCTEEKKVFSNSAANLELVLFDIKSSGDRNAAIEKSDIIIIGGGPLMDLQELFLLCTCIEKAHKRNIPIAVMGCGVGPLNNVDFISAVRKIFTLANGIAFRDSISCELSREIFGESFYFQNLGDPAVISIENYQEIHKNMSKNNSIVVNLREYPRLEYGGKEEFGLNQCRYILNELSRLYEYVELIPMHTFGIGGDDRFFMSMIVNAHNLCNVKVRHKPMNLYELYECYQKAKGCIGMRYHAIVMQTVLNGNNVVLNYTDPKNGKTVGFFSDADKKGFYRDRIVNLQEGFDEQKLSQIIKQLLLNQNFLYEKSNMKVDYVHFLNNILK